jgi:hypothetical protein
MVFNATFKNISIISWRSVLLVEEAGIPGEKHLPELVKTTSSHSEKKCHTEKSSSHLEKKIPHSQFRLL